MRLDLFEGYHLSPVREGDQPAYIQHFADKETTDRLLKIPYPYTQEHADFWVRFRLEAAQKEKKPSHFAVRRTDGFLIGGIGLIMNSGTAAHRAEVGYWLSKDYRGRGLATAALFAITQYAFEQLDLKRIEATSFAHNTASQRVLEKAGYRREGLMEAYHLKEGVFIDACLFAKVNRES